ncbi:MAG: hypothetical protein K0Q60_4237 [Microvirga sp.]|jgi:hypothetical protein|nr:hypothetical protein [Microvirga sp.]MDF2766917.1 hypothetical protein [Rhodospirillales bacterium]
MANAVVHSDELDSTHTAPHFGHRISSRKTGP